MLKTEIECKTTAPLFMAGSNSKEPEIRPASIKGVMRYIWRAAQCADKLEVLRKAEGELFGNTDGSNTCISPWKIQVSCGNYQKAMQDLLPYRRGRGKDGPLPAMAFKPNTTFTVRIIGGKDETQHLNIVRLFVLTCMLGGFGRRSRKGMGTVKVLKIIGFGESVSVSNRMENCTVLLNAVAGKEIYTCENNLVLNKKKNDANYPYIERVELYNCGKDSAEMQEIIGNTVHMNKKDYPRDNFLGSASPRFASSLLLSTITYNKNESDCIVTQLHYAPNPGKETKAPHDEREDFLYFLYDEVRK